MSRELPHERIEAFLDEIEKICRRYGWSLSHDSEQGNFVIEAFSEADIRWLRKAIVDEDALKILGAPERPQAESGDD